MIKKLLFLGILLFSVVVIKNLSTSIWSLWHKSDVMVKAEKQLDEEKQQNQKLKARLSYVETQGFIEEEARNKLFLGKPGEQNVLIDEKLIEKHVLVSVSGKSVPVWQKWMNLFIY